MINDTSLIEYVQKYRSALSYVGKYVAEQRIFNPEVHLVDENLFFECEVKNVLLFYDSVNFYLEEFRDNKFYYYKLTKLPKSDYTMTIIKALEQIVDEYKNRGSLEFRCKVCNNLFNYTNEGKNILEVLEVIKKGHCRKCFHKSIPFKPSVEGGDGYHAVYGDDWTEIEVIEKKRKQKIARKKKSSDYIEKEDLIPQ